MQELVLGTVQLGLPYGINNKDGKPRRDEAFKILDCAWENGITILDTASSYGDSENIIGDFIKNTGKAFKIATKLPKKDDDNNVEEFIDNKLNQSLKNLNVKCIEYYFLHSFNDVIGNEGLLKRLQYYKERNIVRHIGISIYEPSELDYIINNLCKYISVVQIPFNVLDNRWLHNELLVRAKEKGLIIFSRSIYLQGLFFIDMEEVHKIHKDADKYIKVIRDIAERKNVDIKYVLAQYVKQQQFIDYALVGCEKVEQLKNNIKIYNSQNILDSQDVSDILENSNGVPKVVIDPRLWNK